ncbi:MAG TPA: ABC transporter permease subunit [Bacillota bacterium]|nr:ABC transporter permease subunit [Bacillota bacterium]
MDRDDGKASSAGTRIRLRFGALVPLQRALAAGRTTWYADLAVGGGLLALLYVLIQAATGGSQHLTARTDIRLSYSALPIYAGLSFLRMLAAYILAFIFSIAYGYAAAYNRRAERILLPLLDILQSIPILSFLPSFVLALIALFPHGRTGVEIASVLLIFTSQAWNMTFAFYTSLVTIPRELREVAAMHRLSPWQRLRQLELPYATSGLVWNSMMSWAGGWFFLMESEMFTLGSHDFRLPGLGSYLQQAANAGSVGATVAGLLTLGAIIVLLDQLVWRPIVAWSDKFKMELVAGEQPPRSVVLILLRRSRLVAWLTEHVFGPTMEAIDSALTRRAVDAAARAEPVKARRSGMAGAVLTVIVGLLALLALLRGVALLETLPKGLWSQLPAAAGETTLRVLLALAVTTLWTVPAGVAIGLNKPLANALQPVVQILASFPATALFPGIVVAMVGQGGNLNIAAVILMLLGTQWYVLFNVIAGAMAIPDDLKEATTLFGLGRSLRWRTLILPAVFPYLITGLITAAGGAWNATIVAEFVTVRGHTFTVLGLGSLIAQATAGGDYALLLAATATLSILVVAINRLVWRRLYHLAEFRFSLNA